MEVQKEAIARALKLLAAAKCTFAIIEADGTKHGTLEIQASNARTRTALRFPMGALTAYFQPLIKDMKPGDATVIKYGQFGIDGDAKESLRSSLASHCSKHWGNKTYITHMNDIGVELLRVE